MKKRILIGTTFLLAIVILSFSGCGKQCEHQWSDWSVIEESTCFNVGSQERICSVCQEVEKEEIPKKEHQKGDFVVDTEASCSKSGSGHYECSVCKEKLDDEEIPATEHSKGSFIIDTDATCTSEGSGHYECDICNEKIETETIPATGHKKGSLIIDTNASCTEAGSGHYECSICKENMGTQTISATGHRKGQLIVDKKATCTESGSSHYECTVCKTILETISVPGGHTWKNATCTEPKTCTVCGATEGSALGHTGSGTNCTRCGASLEVDMNQRVGSPNDCQQIQELGGFSFYQNSADGIKVMWGGRNNTGKTINYYTITFHFYNPVGDEAYSEITGSATKKITWVGPVAPGEDLVVFTIVDYVPVCSKVQIDTIKLDYSDGTSETGWYGWYTTSENHLIK